MENRKDTSKMAEYNKNRANEERDRLDRLNNMEDYDRDYDYNYDTEAGRMSAKRDSMGSYSNYDAETGSMGKNKNMDKYDAEAGTYSRTNTTAGQFNKDNNRAKNTNNSSYNKTK